MFGARHYLIRSCHGTICLQLKIAQNSRLSLPTVSRKSAFLKIEKDPAVQNLGLFEKKFMSLWPYQPFICSPEKRSVGSIRSPRKYCQFDIHRAQERKIAPKSGQLAFFGVRKSLCRGKNRQVEARPGRDQDIRRLVGSDSQYFISPGRISHNFRYRVKRDGDGKISRLVRRNF